MTAHLLASRADGRAGRARVSWSPYRADAAPYFRACEYPRLRRACQQQRRFLTTVLMTDIVDSTAMATQLGDRRWRDVLADHYAACRDHVGRADGELVNTTGDGIVAIFDGPARAVRAAIAIQAMARQSGIAVRAGLHTGECERLEDGLAGLTVHIAARVSALGCADAVMATGTVRDLAIGSMLAFEPCGHHDLKGVPGRWPVFSATDLA
jgi:class 3 adenylate cyclase